MRKNSPRKWLHAVLDLLPVILIPVFMIFSHRHDVATSSTYTQDVPVYYESNEVTSIDDVVPGNIYHIDYDGVNLSSPFVLELDNVYHNVMQINTGYQVTSSLTVNFPYVARITGYGAVFYFENSNLGSQITSWTCDLVIEDTNNLSVFVSYISESFYLPIKEYKQIIYNFDKDVMGAFMNNFNFTINKYFNMGNVFNLTGVYDWFNSNIFNGNAPQIIYSVWNIALYELVMDLLFLLYGLFMWFIDMVQHLMDKPFKSIK